MAIEGKEARRKATAEKLKPSSAIKHPRQFSIFTSRHGSLDRDPPTLRLDLALLDKLKTIRPSSNSLIADRRDKSPRLTLRSVNSVGSGKSWQVGSEDFKEHVDRLHTGRSLINCKNCSMKGKKVHCWPEDKFGNPDYKKFRARRLKIQKRS